MNTTKGSGLRAQGFALALALALAPMALAGQSAPNLESKVDAVFAKWKPKT